MNAQNEKPYFWYHIRDAEQSYGYGYDGYVGITNDLKRRKKQHFDRLSKGTHPNTKLQDAYDKAPHSFQFVCFGPGGSKKEIEARERLLVPKAAHHLNVQQGGGYGRGMSEEEAITQLLQESGSREQAQRTSKSSTTQQAAGYELRFPKQPVSNRPTLPAAGNSTRRDSTTGNDSKCREASAGNGIRDGAAAAQGGSPNSSAKTEASDNQQSVKKTNSGHNAFSGSADAGAEALGGTGTVGGAAAPAAEGATMASVATAVGVVAAAFATGLGTAYAINKTVLKDDESLDDDERDARGVGRAMSYVGGAAGATVATAVVCIAGEVGLGVAGVTSGLTAIGGVLGGGAVVGAAATLAIPALAAASIAAIGYGIHKGYKRWFA